jgi:hypothetical protein
VDAPAFRLAAARMSAALLEGNVLWSGPPGLLLRAAGVAAAGWLPLALLSALRAGAEPHAAASFASDFAVHARSLVAAPLFIAAERACAPYLDLIGRHFLDAGLLTASDRPRYDAIVRSTQRWCRSSAVPVAALVLAYAVVAAIHAGPGIPGLPAWYAAGDGARSAAGWWHILVSLPLLLALFFGWMWRVLLWTRFLRRVSQLELRLIPAHPDRAGGLLFLAQSLRAFWILAVAIGAVVAGSVANQVAHHGRTVGDHQAVIVACAAFCLTVFAGPLLVFSGKLLRERWRGIMEYGAVADGLGRHFERRWLAAGRSVADEALQAPDFSATADLYATAGNVYGMRFVPTDVRSVVVLSLMALLPFAPVVVLAMPMDVLIEKLSGLLL